MVNAVMGLPLTILSGNTLDEGVDMTQNNYPGTIHEKWAWYPFQRLDSVPSCLLQIMTTSPQLGSAHISAVESMLVIPIPRAAETSKSIID